MTLFRYFLSPNDFKQHRNLAVKFFQIQAGSKNSGPLSEMRQRQTKAAFRKVNQIQQDVLGCFVGVRDAGCAWMLLVLVVAGAGLEPATPRL